MFEILVDDKFLNVLKEFPCELIEKIVDVTISVNKVDDCIESEFIEDFITDLLRR